MNKRIGSIDFLRGIAILIMVAANSWSYLYPFKNCPFILRLIFSSAAPIFIFLSGFSINLSIESGKSIKRIVLRGVQILVIGALIDTLIWKILPFSTFDVLYLIGISTVCIAVCNKFINYVFIGFIAISIYLYNYIHIPYNFNLPDPLLTDSNFKLSLSGILKRFIWDGWFPVFPWMGFAIFGYWVSKGRSYLINYNSYLVIIGSGLIIFYVLSEKQIQPMRDGYTELFYPVSKGFWIYLFGLFALCLGIHYYEFKRSYLIENLGKISLSIYILHAFIIEYVLNFFNQKETTYSWWIFALGYLCFYGLIFIFSFLIKNKTQSLKSNYFAIAYLLGF